MYFWIKSYIFNKILKKKLQKQVKEVKKLNNVLPMSFERPHLDYGDILYYQPNNESMNSKLESLQHSAALAISGVIKRPSRSKFYKELKLSL